MNLPYTLEKALEIYNTGLWLIGSSKPHAVWMGDKIGMAKQYCGSGGGIVVIGVDPGLQLTKRGGGVYIFEIPDAKPYQGYYKIKGLTPLGVLDPKGNRIR